MNNLSFVFILLLVVGFAYQLGMTRSRKVAVSSGVRMHSRPHHYGVLTILWALLPALAVMMLWSWLSPSLIQQLLLSEFADYTASMSSDEHRVLMRTLSNLSSGFSTTSSVPSWQVSAAEQLMGWTNLSNLLKYALMAALVAVGLAYSYRSISPLMRARNKIERALQWLLVACSVVAVLTTIGIVMSMLGETLKFFNFVSPGEFFFGTTWNPRFSTAGVGEGSLTGSQGSFGMLPLLAGTMMVAGIALLVAVPLGLLAAIYLAEYAPNKLRAIAKPIIEILAGIPTIVYGFFALVTMGPFISELGEVLGLTIRATSALTAGMVMGIMIIPFISSLSDDIITQVPKALRDGSLGLGSTKSETIRKVVLPAALPGIVGAILLAASRAIGETMIVVLAAGNSPSLTANPFEAVSTMTVTIVNQLTGDNDFASPQSLVAFALGLTLFAITLLLNVVALVIVRKYREQYE